MRNTEPVTVPSSLVNRTIPVRRRPPANPTCAGSAPSAPAPPRTARARAAAAPTATPRIMTCGSGIPANKEKVWCEMCERRFEGVCVKSFVACFTLICVLEIKEIWCHQYIDSCLLICLTFKSTQSLVTHFTPTQVYSQSQDRSFGNYFMVIKRWQNMNDVLEQ